MIVKIKYEKDIVILEDIITLEHTIKISSVVNKENIEGVSKRLAKGFLNTFYGEITQNAANLIKDLEFFYSESGRITPERKEAIEKRLSELKDIFDLESKYEKLSTELKRVLLAHKVIPEETYIETLRI